VATVGALAQACVGASGSLWRVWAVLGQIMRGGGAAGAVTPDSHQWRSCARGGGGIGDAGLRVCARARFSRSRLWTRVWHVLCGFLCAGVAELSAASNLSSSGPGSSGPPSRSSRASSDVDAATDPAACTSVWSLPYATLPPMDKARWDCRSTGSLSAQHFTCWLAV
jgi:hypothetical protein